MENGFLKGRWFVLVIMVVMTAALFLTRLVSWQIVQADQYKALISHRDTYTVTGDAIRGEIFDVHGEPLAVNLTGYRVVMNKLFLEEERLNEIIERLVTVTEMCGEKWLDALPIRLNDKGQYVFEEHRQADINALKSREWLNMNAYATAGECMVQMIRRYACENYPPKIQRSIVSVRYGMIQKGYSRTQPYIFAEGLRAGSMAVIAGQMNDISGVTVESYAVRTYCSGSLAPHIVGVTGLISQEEYDERKDKGYGYTDTLGKSGIEAAFEEELRGTPGQHIYEAGEDGNVRLVHTVETAPGHSVYLTIDADLQRTAQKALQTAVQQANDYARDTENEWMGADCTGAAVVVLNVRDFSVLCAANYPSYDLSRYYEDYEQLVSDKTLPLFDRAFMGALTPGSTFKPLAAAAALQEKKITAHTPITCSGVYTTGGLRLWCMGYHGEQEVTNALVNSCNVFFAETGRLLGIQALDRYAKRCGLGVKTGVEVPESAGTLAGPDFSEQMGSEWYESFVSPAAIGQSDNQFTPLQLAAYAATIANNGQRLKTHVVDRIVKYATQEVLYRTEPTVMDNMGVSEANLHTVQNAMLLAAESYSLLQDYPIKVAGKTGTAENNGSDHANFICYAPYDDPQIAIAVMVEHGAKSYTAIGVAKAILDQYFHNS